MTTIIVVRHGQSLGNANNEFHGQYNSDLTEKGHTQAECTAKFLDNYKIDAIYSSDIKRAYSTALHTAKRKGLDIITDCGLREINAGKWEKMKFTDIAEKFPEQYKCWNENISECQCPDGERVSELALRVKATFDRISAENDGKTIMMATHATVIRAIKCFADGKDIKEMQNIYWVPNASVTIIECDNCGSYKVKMYAESKHLYNEGLLTELPRKM